MRHVVGADVHKCRDVPAISQKKLTGLELDGNLTFPAHSNPFQAVAKFSPGKRNELVGFAHVSVITPVFTLGYSSLVELH